MGVLIGSVLLGACRGGADPAPFVAGGESAEAPPAQPNALEQALQEATGVPWAVDVDAATGLALFAKPLKSLTVGTSGAESMTFVGKYPQVFGVEPGELVVARDERDANGSKLVSMLQRIADTEVQGSSLAVHLGPSGTVAFIDGHGYRAAQCQIEEAKALKIPFQPVACAWTAVKVVSLEDAKKRYDVSCDGAVSCEGKTDGFYCAPDTASRKATSYQCAGGKIRSQDTCAVCIEHHEDRSKAHCDE